MLLRWSMAIPCLALAACAENCGQPATSNPIDALIGTPGLYETKMDSVIGSDIAGKLDAARTSDPNDLSPNRRVVLQNDIWGLLQRLEEAAAPPRTQRIARAAQALVSHLALSDADYERLDGFRSPPTHPVLFGLEEHSPEHPSLIHERMYGLRRVFRLFLGNDERALVSQLVALDRRGRPRLTSIIGEIEMLELSAMGQDGPLPTAGRVFHIDRATGGLAEIETIESIPDRGANRFIFEAETAVPLADFPCGQCHEDGRMMSLPVREKPDQRLHRILEDIEAELGLPRQSS